MRNILHEAVYNRRTARRKQFRLQARLRERSQFAMVKNMKTIAMNSGGYFFSQMKGNLCFLSQMVKKKCGGRRTMK